MAVRRLIFYIVALHPQSESYIFNIQSQLRIKRILRRLNSISALNPNAEPQQLKSTLSSLFVLLAITNKVVPRKNYTLSLK